MNITKVVLEADSSSIKAATKDLNALQGSGEEAQKTSAALGKAMLAVTAAVGSGIAVVTSAVRANMEFSAAISELSAITGATGKDLEFFAEQSKEIGRTTTLSASQAAQAFKLIASAKPDLLENAQALAAVTREAVLLSQAAGIQLTDAASVVGISLNQFGASADQAARFVNVLAAGAKFGSSEIAESALALKNAGAAANAAGVSFETTNAAIQALAAGGIKAAEAGTSLRNIILILEKEQDSKYRPSVVGLTQAIANMADRQLNLTDLTKIFGRESVVAAQTIMTQSSSLVQLERNMTGTQTATEQAAINVDNLRGDMLMLNSATEALQIEIGQRFDPAVRRATQSITGMAGSAAEFVASDRFADWLKNAQAGAEFLAVVLVARMVPSIIATTASVYSQVAALAVATTTTNVWGQTVVKATGLQNLMTAATGALRSAFLLIGGPVGAIAILVGGLALMISKMESATEMTARLRSQLDKLSREELTRGIEVQKAYIQGIETQIERLGKQNQSVAAVRDRMAELSIKLEEGQKDLQRLENAMRGVEDREFESLIDGMTEGFYGYTAAAKPAVTVTEEFAEETRDASNAVRDFVRSMDAAASSSYNTGSAYVELMGITDQVTVRTTRLTEEQRSATLTNIDAQDAIDGIVERMGRQKTTSEELTQVTAQMRNDISSAFADMMMNGGNAFDNIAKAFERMIYKMVADWAASGIMNILSQLAGGQGGHTSTLGNIFGSLGFGGGGGSGGGTGSTIGSIGSSVLGGATTIGTSVMGGLSTIGTSAMSLLSAIPGWGWALGGLGAAAALLDDSGTMSANGGFLLKDLASVPDDRKFDVAPFASGFDPVGFNRRGSVEEATQVIDMFRAADGALAAVYQAFGSPLVPAVAQNLVGFDETGQGSGVFFGMASEDGKVNSLPLDQQLAMYIKGMIDATYKTGYFGADTYNKMDLSGSYLDMIASASNVLLGADGSHATGLNYVPFDGYRGIMHKGEAVITARGNEAIGMMAASLSEMRSIMAAVAQHTAKTARQLERWEFGGLPEERVFA